LDLNLKFGLNVIFKLLLMMIFKDLLAAGQVQRVIELFNSNMIKDYSMIYYSVDTELTTFRNQ